MKIQQGLGALVVASALSAAPAYAESGKVLERDYQPEVGKFISTWYHSDPRTECLQPPYFLAQVTRNGKLYTRANNDMFPAKNGEGDQVKPFLFVRYEGNTPVEGFVSPGEDGKYTVSLKKFDVCTLLRNLQKYTIKKT